MSILYKKIPERLLNMKTNLNDDVLKEIKYHFNISLIQEKRNPK